MNKGLRNPFAPGLVVVGAAVMAITATTAIAVADPDPHIPDFAHGICPGQRPGVWQFTGNCDGVPYADGSFWRAFGVGFTVMSVTCMAPGGGAPAAPGGCEGRPVPDVSGYPLSTP